MRVTSNVHAGLRLPTLVADTQPTRRFKGYAAYIYDIFGILQVSENEISLRKWSGGTAHAHLGGIMGC